KSEVSLNLQCGGTCLPLPSELAAAALLDLLIAILLVRSVGLWHGHASYDAPVPFAPQPRMCDTQSMRPSTALLIHPSERYPIARERDVPSHLNCSRLKLDGLERQSLCRLRRNPIGDVILMDGCGTNRRPTKEIP